jgi:hypothetical protein
LPQAVTLFAAFTENVAPLVRIFHMPSLTRTYWDAVASLNSLDKHTEALLFAIHYSALISLTPEQCLSILEETRESALERYRFAVEQALARGNLLNTQNTAMLQAAVLFLSALPNEDDSRAAWSLTSLIYHIARTMGLHRDGTGFGLKPFETELRRRLWWQICIIDSRSSEYHCNEPIARGFASDTKPPLHINDADLSPEMVEPPAERWDRATDMTLSLVRCEAIQTGWKLGLVQEKRPSGEPGSTSAPTDDSREAPAKRQALIQNLESRLRDKYLPICDSSVPFQLLSSAVARIILARFRLITQYSVASNKSGATPDNTNSQLENKTRNELFYVSIDILQVSSVLLTNSDIKQFTWYSKTHIQWGAMAFVLSELCTRPHSPECDRAWDCVTAVYGGWKGGGGNHDDEGRLALWRPIRRLMAKVRYVREMQRTDPARRTNQRQNPSRGVAASSAAAASAAASTVAVSPCPPAASLANHEYPLAAHGAGSWYTPSQQTVNSVPTPEFSVYGPSSAPYSPDALQRVLGVETLGPFLDFLPAWSWSGEDGDTPSLAGMNFGYSLRFS